MREAALTPSDARRRMATNASIIDSLRDLHRSLRERIREFRAKFSEEDLPDYAQSLWLELRGSGKVLLRDLYLFQLTCRFEQLLDSYPECPPQALDDLEQVINRRIKYRPWTDCGDNLIAFEMGAQEMYALITIQALLRGERRP